MESDYGKGVACKEGLARRGIQLNNILFDRCGYRMETLDHLFVDCLFARSIWWNVFAWVRVSWPMNCGSLNDLLQYILGNPGSKKWKKLIHLVPACYTDVKQEIQLNPPPEACYTDVKQEIQNDEAINDHTNNFMDEHVNENFVSPQDEGVHVVFRVDNKYRMKKPWAQKHGLDKKVEITVIDNDGGIWYVKVNIEFDKGNERYYIPGLRSVVKDKKLALGDQM